ncbi:MAG: putative transposase [Streptomyces sp.]|nr:putative transposase [Streptomyces sp.]
MGAASRRRSTDRVLTAVVPLWLNRADHEMAHAGCHASAQLWNAAVTWVRGEWDAGRSPGREDTRRYVESLAADMHPLHSQTVQGIAYDLWEMIRGTQTRRRKGETDTRFPWREKRYRPLSFTANFGWRLTPQGAFALSFGKGRRRIVLPVPEFVGRDGTLVTPERWGEVKLCWDLVARGWFLHISYYLTSDALPDTSALTDEHHDRVVTVAVDEGIVNAMTLAAPAPDGAMEVLVVNGRSARSIKRERNKAVGKIQSKLARCRNGSRRHRRLVLAKKKSQANAKSRLRDFNHQVTAKANAFVRKVVDAHRETAPDGVVVAVRLVVGDAREVERDLNRKRRSSRRTRQQLSQWERGTQERQLAYKTGLAIEHIDEAFTSQTCPACGCRRRMRGRWYKCRNEMCRFRSHRDVVGGVNIHTLAVNDGTFVPAGPGLQIRVMYLRAQVGWSTGQRSRHAVHQHALRRAGRPCPEARSSALNRAPSPLRSGGRVAVVRQRADSDWYISGTTTAPAVLARHGVGVV